MTVADIDTIRTTDENLKDWATEWAEYDSSGLYSQANGRSYFYAGCPFCDRELKCYPWSLAGCGKKCTCKAMLYSGGVAARQREYNWESGATFNPETTHRYVLWRVWAHHGNARLAAFIGLNPSTADDINNDNTVRRCIGFAERWGYDGMVMLNAYAFRTKSPAVMKKARDPVGRFNDQYIWRVLHRVDKRVACWGSHVTHRDRGPELHGMLYDLGLDIECFGTNQDGEPKHPLYLANATETQKLDLKFSADQA